MNYMKTVFVFLFLAWALISCNNLANEKSTGDKLCNSYFEDSNIKQHLHPKDTFFLSRLKHDLGKAFNDSNTFYALSSLSKPNTDYWKLLKDSNLVANWSYKFANRIDTSQFVTLDVFVMKQYENAENLIDEYCDNERVAELLGRKTEFQKEALANGLPCKTFKDGDVIYVLNASPSALTFLTNGFAEFRGRQIILAQDIIPSDRQYITPDMKKKLEPILNKWLQFHKIDLAMFYGGVDSNQNNVFEYDASTDTVSVHYNSFAPEYNVYNPVLYDYSPDRNSFLKVRSSAGVYQEEKDGKYYYYGGDDCQSIWLVQRKNKRVGLIKWNGAIQFTLAAYWLDNQTFALISNSYYSAMEFQIQIFGKKNYSYSYRNGRVDWTTFGSYFEQDLKARGIITD